MQTLNLPDFDIKVRVIGAQQWVFDIIRRKYVVLTPEEWVRQHFINFLVVHSNYPRNLMAIEKLVKVNGLKQRADIVVHSRHGNPLMVVECKAPEVPINQATLTQAARYNLSLGASYLVITNGTKQYCCRVDLRSGAFELLKGIPTYAEMSIAMEK